MDTIKIENPLLCDPESGICEVPNTTFVESNENPLSMTNKPIKLVYFTDPVCSFCWGIEPQLKRLKLEYGDSIEVEYRMGGLLKDWSYNAGGISKPSDVAHHWDEVSGYVQMPIDGDIWLEDPLASSYPPSIAFKAAQVQGEERALTFLRRMREMVFLEKTNIAKWENISQAAVDVGLDTSRLKTDYETTARTRFEEDLKLSQQMGVRGFPTLVFLDTAGKRQVAYGARSYDDMEKSIQKLVPNIQPKVYTTTPEYLFNEFATLTTKEYAVLTNKSMEVAEKELVDLFEKKLLKKFETKNGPLWIGKSTRF